MQLLVLGHITRDYIAGEERLGGAASYATRVASCGSSTAVTHAPWVHRCSPLLRDSDSKLHRVDSVPTTFELVYGPSGRTIRLLERAPTLQLQDIPALSRGSCGLSCPRHGRVPTHFIGRLQLHKWLACRASSGGRTRWARCSSPFDIEGMPAGLTAAVFSDEDHPDADELAASLSTRIRYVVLTRGAAGLTLFRDGSPQNFQLCGSTPPTRWRWGYIGAALTAGLIHGLPIHEALERAIVAASLVVQGPELGELAAQGGASLCSWSLQG